MIKQRDAAKPGSDDAALSFQIIKKGARTISGNAHALPAFERARYLSARGLRDHRPNFEKSALGQILGIPRNS